MGGCIERLEIKKVGILNLKISKIILVKIRNCMKGSTTFTNNK